jgi:two-component system chemotaxis response regulator CheY
MKKVLVVDDSALVRRQVGNTHEKISGAKDIAMIVCDVTMPRMNGLELLTALKQDGYGGTIVMLTTEGRPDVVTQARSLGAKGWLVKPLKPELLLATVAKLVA